MKNTAIAAHAHAVVLMGCAGCHRADKLKVQENLTIVLLPSRSPELNPVENVWQYLRMDWLFNRVFENYTAVLDAACGAWNKLIAKPQTIIVHLHQGLGLCQSIILAAGISPWTTLRAASHIAVIPLLSIKFRPYL